MDLKMSRYFIDSDGIKRDKKTFKKHNNAKMPYGIGAGKTRQMVCREIAAEGLRCYLNDESLILRARSVLETRVIPLNIYMFR